MFVLGPVDTTISRILDDVLSLQKIEDGAFELHLIPFTLRSLVDNVSRSFNPAATAKGLQLQVNVLHCAAPYLDGASANDADRHSNITSSQALATTLTSPAALVSTLKPAAAPAQGEPLLLGDFYRLQQVLANFVSNGKG